MNQISATDRVTDLAEEMKVSVADLTSFVTCLRVWTDKGLSLEDAIAAHTRQMTRFVNAAVDLAHSIEGRRLVVDTFFGEHENTHLNLKATSVPSRIGMGYQGGFYAGRIVVDGKTYALVVAPKAEGEHSGLPWKKDWKKPTPGAQSLCDGRANSGAMTDGGHPAAQWCRDLKIGAFDDWYLPSRDELEILYRNLKPTDADNWTYESRLKRQGAEPGEYNGVDDNGNGHNASSDPVGTPYTDSVPEQTTSALFLEGGEQAFEAAWYWSSTEFGSDTAWGQSFGDGYQYDVVKLDALRVRAVRKVLI